MENPEEILHSLEEFTKCRPKVIPRDLEEYLCFVAKTGDPVYPWPTIKSLFHDKMLTVITEFYETCPTSLYLAQCPNVEVFNYDTVRSFILEKLETFSAAPFTVQRICELLTAPHKEYNRIDKYMRALEKNVLVVSTVEPGVGGARSTTGGGNVTGVTVATTDSGIMNGLIESDVNNPTSDVTVDVELEETPTWRRITDTIATFSDPLVVVGGVTKETPTSSTQDSVITTCRLTNQDEEQQNDDEDDEQTTPTTTEPPTSAAYVSIEPIVKSTIIKNDEDDSVTVTITPIPAGVQKRRTSIEPPVVGSTEDESAQKLPPIETITCSTTSKLLSAVVSVDLPPPPPSNVSTTPTPSGQDVDVIVDDEITSSLITEKPDNSDDISSTENSPTPTPEDRPSSPVPPPTAAVEILMEEGDDLNSIITTTTTPPPPIEGGCQYTATTVCPMSTTTVEISADSSDDAQLL